VGPENLVDPVRGSIGPPLDKAETFGNRGAAPKLLSISSAAQPHLPFVSGARHPRFVSTLADLTTDEQLDCILDGSVSPPHLCLGGLVQYRLNVDSRALLAKMPLFGIGLASDHSQLLLHRLVLAAEIANIDCGHERSPFR
jgi:hypothetical protein